MALGRNLKRQQLIPGGEQAKEEQPVARTTARAAPKKKTSPKPTAKKSTAKKSSAAKTAEKKTVAKKTPKAPPKREVAPKAVDQKVEETPVDVVTPAAESPQIKETPQPEEEAQIAPKQHPVEAAPTQLPAQEEPVTASAPLPETEPTPAPKLPTYEVARPTYLNRQEVTVVSQREYDKRLKLKQKFDTEIRELKGKKLLLIVFKLGGQEFAIEIDKTKEVVKTPEIAPMPHLPEHMIGVANVRGKVVLIMDLGRKFHIADGAAKWEDPYSIVIQNSGYKIGLLVPEVPNTMMVEGNNISTAAAIVTDTARDETYIKGIVKQEGRMIFFLDIEELVEGNKVNVVPDEVAV